ncbi:MAG: PCRF domain-containing protein, partial [Candidatus Latescibacteria bacterium]|nr:PCRF domain-containing protein [Candidatus Latescibacterota bacterium]
MFDPEKKQAELKKLYEQREAPNFWTDQRAAQKVIDEITLREKPIKAVKDFKASLDDVAVLNELAEEEEDNTVLAEVTSSLENLEKKLSDLEFQNMLGNPEDPKNAILSINSGAGGTESQDWAQMLLRMYLRWIERRGFDYDEIDIQPGQEAGIKSVTILVKGEYVYGYLKAESGVHRL